MESASADHRIRIISQGYNTWRVQVLFTERNLSANEITARLQEVKQELARHFGTPDYMLQYARLIGRQQVRHGLLVQMQIVKQDRPSGPPAFRAKPLRLEDGSFVSDMVLEADLYPYDEFDHRLTRLVIEARLKGAGFDLFCVDWDEITGALVEMEQTEHPVMGLTIGNGRPPGLGRSSRITYGISHDQESFLSSAWMGVRPVQKGDFLVEVSQPIAGHQWGRNVFGRELEPQQGLQTRLEAGDGTQLWLRGTQLVAHRDGLLVFERNGRDKRDCDTRGMALAKLTGRVLPAKTLEQTGAFDIEIIEPTIIMGDVASGSRIHARAPLFIAGNVEEDARVECSFTLRIGGEVRKAKIKSLRHCCITGFVTESKLECGFTLQFDAGVLNSALRATDVLGREIRGGAVEALRQTSFDSVEESGGAATAIRINLRRFLENQQVAGREAIADLRRSLAQIQDIFGPDIVLQVTESTAQRMLLHWLRQQKSTGGGNFTHAEVQELRTILEVVPLIRQQMAAMGMELRDITTQLVSCENEPKT
jgi:hypothetical protein